MSEWGGGCNSSLWLEAAATTMEQLQKNYLWLVESQFIVGRKYNFFKVTLSLFTTVSHDNSLWSEDTSFGKSQDWKFWSPYTMLNYI